MDKAGLNKVEIVCFFNLYYKQRTLLNQVKALYKLHPTKIKSMDFPRIENNIPLQEANWCQRKNNFEWYPLDACIVLKSSFLPPPYLLPGL